MLGAFLASPGHRVGRCCKSTGLNGTRGRGECAAVSPGSAGLAFRETSMDSSIITTSLWTSVPALFYSKDFCKLSRKPNQFQLHILPLHTAVAEAQMGRRSDTSQVDRRVETAKKRDQLHFDRNRLLPREPVVVAPALLWI